jgi:hypothetical protein
MAEDFFKRFDNEMQRRFPAAEAAVPVAAVPVAEGTAVPTWVWVAIAFVIAVVILLVNR